MTLSLLPTSCTDAITKEQGELPEEDAALPVADPRVIQEGNDLPETQLQPKQSPELKDNRIGIHFTSLWNLEPEVFPNGVLDAGHILKIGVKRARFTINNLDADRVHWDKPEFSIDPSHDEFITSLADSGIIITFVLSFWDTEYVAQGGEINIPRFKTEEEIQRYLDFVRFIVHHLKDRIEYYEIWNEPNIENHEQWIEVDDYINLVKRAVPVIRQEYPEAKIVVGGTYSLMIEESRNYLFAILRSDIMPLVDVVSWHGWSNTSPEYENLRDYYYEYPTIMQEIKDVASAHGFEGEYVADELHWTPLGTTEFIEYSETKCAKYYARGIIMHLGMDVSVSQFYIVPQEHPWQIVHTIENLCTVMAGTKPISLPLEIRREDQSFLFSCQLPWDSTENTQYYSFSLPNGDKLVALWIDGVAVDEDPGINTTVTIAGVTAQKVVGIDVLYGFEQELITNIEDGNLVIENLLVKDYPIVLQLSR